MKMNKKKAILFIAGVGGHQAQIKRIFEGLKSTLTTNENIEILYLTELGGGGVENSSINIIEVPDLRNKHFKIKNIFSTPYAMFKQQQIIFKLLNIYDIKICISTGPGLCIIPSFILNLNRSSIIITRFIP